MFSGGAEIVWARNRMGERNKAQNSREERKEKGKYREGKEEVI